MVLLSCQPSPQGPFPSIRGRPCRFLTDHRVRDDCVEKVILVLRAAWDESDNVGLGCWREVDARHVFVDSMTRALDWGGSGPKKCYPGYPRGTGTGGSVA